MTIYTQVYVLNLYFNFHTDRVVLRFSFEVMSFREYKKNIALIIYKKESKFACIISLLPWSFSIALIFQYFNSAIWVIRFTPKVLHVNQHKIETFENIKSNLFWFIRRNLTRKVISVDTTIHAHVYIMHRLSFHCSDMHTVVIYYWKRKRI